MEKQELKNQDVKKGKGLRRRVSLLIDVIAVLAYLFWMFGPRLMAGMSIKNFTQYAQSVEEIAVPDARIVALGEGTHGTKEFHQLKLSVFQQLVKQGFRAFAMEATFGDCALINEYINGSEMTLDEAVSHLTFRCYRTDEMRELIQWMREYNEGAGKDETIRFYGFDIQYYDSSAKHILSFLRANECKAVEQYADWLDTLDRPDREYGDELDSVLARMEAVKALVEAYQDESSAEWRRTMMDCEAIMMGMRANYKNAQYMNKRDEYMAKCVSMILEEEEKHYGGRIMLSAHTGHIAKGQTSYYKTMGMYLDEMYGSDYMAIGTDFYTGTVNLPSASGRTIKKFATGDPLAAQVKKLSIPAAYIDFSAIPAEESLYRIVHKKMDMGSLGESYSPMMYILPNLYRISKVPAEFYDGMIVIYEGTATEVPEA